MTTNSDTTEAEKHVLGRLGYQAFRPYQKEIVRASIAGRDLVAVMPTGSGKSLCYEFPPLAMNVIGVVVSPLIALMQDQVDNLQKRGIKACFLGSHQTQAVERDAFLGKYDIVFVTPEKLLSFAIDNFVSLHRQCRRIGLIAVDEAHCIDKWGHDFRPAYKALGSLRDKDGLGDIPIAAFTATATIQVQRGIAKNLKLQDPMYVRAAFDRPNLFYAVDVTKKDRLAADTLGLLNKYEVGKKGCAVVYCIRRDDCETLASNLGTRYRTAFYHGGMTPANRDETMIAFIGGKLDCIVATIAFGMGIDKPDVRIVVNAGMPKSVGAYLQQSGRAGRDGRDAGCHILYTRQEFIQQTHHLQSADIERKPILRKQMQGIFDYVGDVGCRRKYLEAMADGTRPPSVTGHKKRPHCCDLCESDGKYVSPTRLSTFTSELDALREVVRYTKATIGYTFGPGTTLDILCGSNTKVVRDRGLDRRLAQAFGSGKSFGHTKKWWNQLIQLSLKGDGVIAFNAHKSLTADSGPLAQVRRSKHVETLLSTLEATKKKQRRRAFGNRTSTKSKVTTKSKPTQACTQRKVAVQKNVKTMELWKKGFSLDEIASELGKTRATIGKHVLGLVLTGMEMDPDRVASNRMRNVLGVLKDDFGPEPKFREVRDKLYEVLRSGKDGLPATKDKIKYEELRIAWACV